MISLLVYIEYYAVTSRATSLSYKITRLKSFNLLSCWDCWMVFFKRETHDREWENNIVHVPPEVWWNEKQDSSIVYPYWEEISREICNRFVCERMPCNPREISDFSTCCLLLILVIAQESSLWSSLFPVILQHMFKEFFES